MQQSDTVAVLRLFGAIEEVAELGDLPEHAAAHLGLSTGARTVWLHPNTGLHIYTQRGLQRGDAEWIFAHLPRAVADPHFCGCDPRTPRRYDLVHLPHGADRALFVAIKEVAAAASPRARDEIWVSTAHALPLNFMARKRYRDTMREVRGPLDEGVRGDYLEGSCQG